MTEQKVKELAQLYGIEINSAEVGKGGIFYIDSEDNKEEIKDIFNSDTFITSKHENVSLRICKTYSTYSEMGIQELSVA